jgi:hypothetical protein
VEIELYRRASDFRTSIQVISDLSPGEENVSLLEGKTSLFGKGYATSEVFALGHEKSLVLCWAQEKEREPMRLGHVPGAAKLVPELRDKLLT